MANKEIIDLPTSVDIGTADTFSGQLAAGGDGSTRRWTPTQIRGNQVICVTDREYGAIGSGVVDDTVAIQAAIDAGDGKTVYFPVGTYYCTSLLMRVSNCTLLAEPGATILNAAASPNNILFTLGKSPLDTVDLVTSTVGGRTIVVADGSSFSAGDYIILNAGTFTGSGVERGPCQFTQVLSVAGPTLTLVDWVQDNFADFGLPGQDSPNVYRIGPAPYLNNRITGFRFLINPNLAFNGLLFATGYAWNVEIDNNIFVGSGQGLMTAGPICGLYFHDNHGYGEARPGGTALNPATMTRSRITRNKFNFTEASDPQFGNVLAAEVFTDDCEISYNEFYPHDWTNGGAIELTFNARRNRIVGNRIIGQPNNTTALGIRTFANANGGFTGGNVITDNILSGFTTLNGINQTNNSIGDSTVANNIVVAASV